MPATLKFPSLCARLKRAAVYVRGLQKRFELPIPEEGIYPATYAAFLENVIHLRVLGVSEESLLDLWHLERKLMQLLHADSTGSPTWFLDACGSKRQRNHRLLLSNFDIGVFLPSGAIQLGLNFADQPTPELFTGPEMGDDAIAVLKQYLTAHRDITTIIDSEIPLIRAAIHHFQRRPSLTSPKRP